MKVGIIGAGNVGITSAFAIAEKGSANIMLFDVVEGRAKGKALDLAEAAPLRQYDLRIDGTDRFEDVLESDIFVITAGRPRRDTMKRFDLFDDNLPVVKELAVRIKNEYRRSTPPVVVVLTEPVDVMTRAFLRYSELPREKVVGVGGVLSASRLKYFISQTMDISPGDVDAMVVGTHGEHMVILERYCRISGLPVNLFLERGRLDELIHRTVAAGDEIVRHAKLTGSFYTPGAAAAVVVDSVARGASRVVSVSTLLDGEYGLKNVCVSVPVRLGKGGITRVFELQLTGEERQRLAASAETQYPFLSRI